MGFFGLHERPLTSGPVWDAWQALGDVRELTDAVRGRVRAVLGATVCGSAHVGALPLPPPSASAGARPRPTAAHPRAYQGTTYKPPKSKAVPSVDLRPYLCDPRGLDWLLTALGEAPSIEYTLPEAFRVSLWPFLREQCPSDVPGFLSVFWALRLDERPTLRAAVAALAHRQADANTLRWLQFITEQPAPWQELCLSLLIESKAYTLDAECVSGGNRERLAQVRDGNWPVHRLFWLLCGLARGFDPEYLIAGYRMSDRDRGNDSFASTRQSGYFPDWAVSDLMAHLASADVYYAGLALSVWRSCGELPGLGQIIARTDWRRLAPDVARSYLWLYEHYASEDLAPRRRDAKWAFLRNQAPQIEAHLHAVPAIYQGKWVAALRKFIWALDEPNELAECLPAAFVLLRRLARPPFRPSTDTAHVTVDFLGNLDVTRRERFLNAPDSCFRHLEKACRRRDDAWLIGCGAWSLTRLLPELAVDGFVNAPGKLWQVGKLLGCLSDPMRDDAVRAFREKPGLPDGVRERLEMLEASTLVLLAQNFGPITAGEASKHALQMYYQADDDNRRAFRKFLQAYWHGQTDYLHTHPRTQAWRERHPGVDVDAWRRGVTLTRDLPWQGAVQLAVEQDPLEALKLGTHVGSCLGLGGSYTHSAQAVVLDVNKQVVYARDAKGNVAARQTVAIADEERLVCFEVYPQGVCAEIKRAFADFDRRLAGAVGLPVFDPDTEDDYTISHILSHRWWDDCAWNLAVEDEDAG